MKTLLKLRHELEDVGRWDIDYHLPPEGIKIFPRELLKRVDEVADVIKDTRDPRKETEMSFQYIDIAAVDVTVGTIVNPQVLEGSEAPSRARKVVRAFDVIVSTCRPTRGAIAIVPISLHDQIASTAFSIVRANPDVNPFYLHFALRLQSTLEQFRKWSTGSSYPAILDSDVKKTIIPVPTLGVQDAIAAEVYVALQQRSQAISEANIVWGNVLSGIIYSLTGKIEPLEENEDQDAIQFEAFTLASVHEALAELPVIRTESSKIENGEDDVLIL